MLCAGGCAADAHGGVLPDSRQALTTTALFPGEMALSVPRVPSEPIPARLIYVAWHGDGEVAMVCVCVSGGGGERE